MSQIHRRKLELETAIKHQEEAIKACNDSMAAQLAHAKNIEYAISITDSVAADKIVLEKAMDKLKSKFEATMAAILSKYNKGSVSVSCNMSSSISISQDINEYGGIERAKKNIAVSKEERLNYKWSNQTLQKELDEINSMIEDM